VVIANEIDYLRELLSEAVNVLINQMAGRLTIVATVFLPLTVRHRLLRDELRLDGRPHLLGRVVPDPRRGWDDPPLIVAAVLLLRSGYLQHRRVPTPLNADVHKASRTGSATERWRLISRRSRTWTPRRASCRHHGRMGHPAGARGRAVDAFQVEEIEVPEPGAFEVIVRVMAAGVNFNNVWAALGKPVSVFRYHPDEDHHIGGSDASGVVWKVGPGRDTLEARRRGRRALQPGLLRGSRGPRPRSAGRALTADLGL
jgi:hypothetical protein